MKNVPVLFCFCSVIASKNDGNRMRSQKVVDSISCYLWNSPSSRRYHNKISHFIRFLFFDFFLPFAFGSFFPQLFLFGEKQKDETLTINNVITYQFDYKNGFIRLLWPTRVHSIHKPKRTKVICFIFLSLFLDFSYNFVRHFYRCCLAGSEQMQQHSNWNSFLDKNLAGVGFSGFKWKLRCTAWICC